MVYMEFHNYRQEAYAAQLARAAKVSHKITVTSTLRDRTPQPQPKPLDEAEGKIGGPSQFSWGRNSQDFREGVVPSTSWEQPSDPDRPADDPPPEDNNPAGSFDETWEEIDRKESKVRINGPGGAYVDFMRMDEVTWRLPTLPDGRSHTVTQKFKTAGGSGSSSPGSV